LNSLGYRLEWDISSSLSNKLFNILIGPSNTCESILAYLVIKTLSCLVRGHILIAGSVDERTTWALIIRNTIKDFRIEKINDNGREKKN
jgi:hypothetical protein